ncbi:hypothetical protein [Cupriavidus necator]
MALFKDKDGNMIEVTDVVFFPQGGGLQMRMPWEEFQSKFEPVTEPAPYRLVQATADWFEEGVTVPAYWNGDRWNGWAMPMFPLPSLPRLAELMPDVLEWDEKDGMLYCIDEEMTADGSPIVWQEIYIDDKPVPVVMFDGWCWDIAGDDDAE